MEENKEELSTSPILRDKGEIIILDCKPKVEYVRGKQHPDFWDTDYNYFISKKDENS